MDRGANDHPGAGEGEEKTRNHHRTVPSSLRGNWSPTMVAVLIALQDHPRGLGIRHLFPNIVASCQSPPQANSTFFLKFSIPGSWYSHHKVCLIVRAGGAVGCVQTPAALEPDLCQGKGAGSQAKLNITMEEAQVSPEA